MGCQRKPARQIAAVLGRELLGSPRDTRVASSIKIAERFVTSNPADVRAGYHLMGARIIYRSDTDRHYYVA